MLKINAKFWQNTVMALICCSFIYANIRHGAANTLWRDSPESMILFLTVGVGLKMGKDVAEKTINMKYTNGNHNPEKDKGI